MKTEILINGKWVDMSDQVMRAKIMVLESECSADELGTAIGLLVRSFTRFSEVMRLVGDLHSQFLQVFPPVRPLSV